MIWYEIVAAWGREGLLLSDSLEHQHAECSVHQLKTNKLRYLKVKGQRLFYFPVLYKKKYQFSF